MTHTIKAISLLLISLLLFSACGSKSSNIKSNIQISSSDKNVAYIDSTGALWTWGDNSCGQLGNGKEETTWSNNTANQLTKVMDDAVKVCCGFQYTAAIKKDGSLWLWGNNEYGQLGDGTYDNSSTPVKIMDHVSSVLCAETVTAAITDKGELWTWGSNFRGQLGNDSTEDSAVPVKIMDDVSSVSYGNAFFAAVKTDGSLWMWGMNDNGQLGDGGCGFAEADSHVPEKILDDVVSVACGDDYTAAVKSDGTLWAWGKNYYGQLGVSSNDIPADYLRNYDSSVRPVKVLDGIASVTIYQFTTAAIGTDGTLWMWGGNDSGQVGNGEYDRSCYSPYRVMDDVISVSLSYSHTAAVTKDGTLFAWGFSGDGSLGNGKDEYDHVTKPTAVLDGVIAARCQSGITPYTLAVKKDGSLWFTGNTMSGLKIDDGEIVDRYIIEFIKIADKILIN